ncbi:hypothetical protein GTS_27180 [Gandjariella thermophila]|uniref:DUF3558 domain-containing protein n=1 Tax=Gandjariella thermophila TaxID=1931992 RepID=A0A4D4J341_9PSEU|nr:hypothetical protein GTS_27180 [Gandjariella thermophila]
MLVGCAARQLAGPAHIPTFETSPPPPRPTVTDRELPRDCLNVATGPEVDQIVGHPLAGSTGFVLGVPDPRISRTARIDCYYGVPEGQPFEKAAVSIAMATYADEPTAAQRMRSTVDDARQRGVATSEVQVGPDRGVLLADNPNRTLVDQHGKTTVLVSAAPGALPEDRAGEILAALAVRALTPHTDTTTG